MTFAEFVAMLQNKAIAEFCHCSLLEVYEWPEETRTKWWRIMQEFNQHMQMLREGVASAKEQGAEAQDYLQMLLNMQPAGEQGGQNAE